jgi:Flp pilus assembly protein TadG
MMFVEAWRRARALTSILYRDSRGVAAVEFALIVPIMLVMFFGTVEMSSGVAVYRKVTLMARTLSDLTSQSTSVQDADLTNFFAASTGIMTPYATAPVQATIMEIWVNPSLQARVQWSSGPASVSPGTVVTVPAGLAVANSYLIYSTVSYLYTPTIGYVMSIAGVHLSDFSYTRPRQSTCVMYDAQTVCPTT